MAPAIDENKSHSDRNKVPNMVKFNESMIILKVYQNNLEAATYQPRTLDDLTIASLDLSLIGPGKKTTKITPNPGKPQESLIN